ncbi:MAG TPA: endo-1,4-beta-xylanase [Tepidisphaeraceae bacterium]|nr:endo-1,4-beta-xylanase [Tepidisphaeraceae bacterium]
MARPTRRAIVKTAAALTAGAMIPREMYGQVESLGREFVDAPTTRAAGKGLTLRLREADGSLLDRERARTITVRDMHGDPLPVGIDLSPGVATVALPKEPVQITIRLKIPGFGEVYCYADNGGAGYAEAKEVQFVLEAAKTRLARVEESLKKGQDEGVVLPESFQKDLEGARSSVRQGYSSLAQSMRAGEMLALERARHRIEKMAGPRKEFLFGCMVAGYDSSPKYNKAIEDAYNYATVAWYTWKMEQPPEQRIDYGRMDGSINWCLKRGIVPKTFAYTYMARGATPEWIRPADAATRATKGSVFNERWGYEQLLALYKQVDEQTARRYAGKPVPVIEVINEAHDKANLWRMNHQQILEMTRESCAAVRRGNPTIRRQINHCCLWGEYAKERNWDGSRRWTPYTYLKDCLAHGVEFEVVGLQLYYPQYDLFEIDRMLERFADFGKPCQITECATQSEDGPDLASMRPRTPTPGWHGPWNETMQADWLEGIYTLCYSKPHFEAVGWWDMADAGGHFWPFGGVLRKDLSPKESYMRLLALQKKWGVGKSA